MDKNKFIKRAILRPLEDHLKKKEITLIVGPRQAGKTTLMNKLKEFLEKNNAKILFLNLDFENDKKYFVSQSDLIDKINLEFGKSKGYVFIDEIQRKEDAGLFLKGIYDKNLLCKFIVSGSGSLELKEKIHESLAGRKMMFEVKPISFSEFVNYKTDYKYESKLNDFFNIEKDEAEKFLKEYMNFGGYPRVILEDTFSDKARIIDEIYRSYLERDASYLLRIEKIDAFDSLVKLLASQTGKILNYSKISNTLNISLQTVKNYLWYLGKTFILEKVSPYFKNIRKEIIKSPIVYFYDLGLRNYSLGLFGELRTPDSLGFSFQNFVFNVLVEKRAFSGAKINFWRTLDKAEVDFIYSWGEKIIPIEVKYANFKKPILQRSLRSFIDKYNPKTALVVTKNFKAQIDHHKTKIQFLPFWELIVNQSLFL